MCISIDDWVRAAKINSGMDWGTIVTPEHAVPFAIIIREVAPLVD